MVSNYTYHRVYGRNEMCENNLTWGWIRIKTVNNITSLAWTQPFGWNSRFNLFLKTYWSFRLWFLTLDYCSLVIRWNGMCVNVLSELIKRTYQNWIPPLVSLRTMIYGDNSDLSSFLFCLSLFFSFFLSIFHRLFFLYARILILCGDMSNAHNHFGDRCA